MYGVDKAAVLLLLAPAIARGLPTTITSDPPKSAPEDHAVVSRLDTGAVIVRFQAACAGCEHDSWPIDLATQSTGGVCEDVTISVNGRSLDHQWHGNTSWGSGAIPATSQHKSGSEIHARWRSECIAPSSDTTSKGHIYVLAVFLNNGTPSSQDLVGFMISFTLSDQVEILRLSNFSLPFSGELEWETWAYSDNAKGESDPQEAQRLVRLQDTTRISNPHQHQKRKKTILAVGIPTDYPTKKLVRNCAIAFLIILIIALVFRTIRRSTAFRRRRRDIASRREEQRARRAYNNAARRLRLRQWWENNGSTSTSDTRSVRSSYSLAELQRPAIAAADHTQHNHPSDHHSSHHGDHRYDDINGTGGDDYDSSLEDEEENTRGGGMIQAEILGLRRVLEYVGELVGNESSSMTRRSNRSRSRSRAPPRYDELHHSPRASTMFSLDTGSLGTLDTTDLETAPPSYHA